MGFDQRRKELHEVLCEILGSRQCYFQPPETVKMEYPAIVYELQTNDAQYADNASYIGRWSYSVTVITRDPETDIPGKVEKLPLCRANRFYQADNLNHYNFTLFY